MVVVCCKYVRCKVKGPSDAFIEPFQLNIRQLNNISDERAMRTVRDDHL